MTLLADLERLGEKVIAADLPHDARKILGALVHSIEQTGWKLDLTPPPEPLGREEVREVNEDKAEVERLRVELADAQAAAAQTSVPPQQPSATAPSESTGGSSPEPGAAPSGPPPAESA